MWSGGRRDFSKLAGKFTARVCLHPRETLEQVLLAAEPLPKNDFFGLNITHPVNYKHTKSIDEHFTILSSLNPGTVKLEARSENNEGIDFERTKVMLKRSKENGFRTLLLVNNAIIPKSPFFLVNEGDAYVEAFCEKIDYLVSLLGAYVDAWQIMNEPNDNVWLYDDSGTKMYSILPEQFAKLVIGSSKIIKRRFLEAKVITGGLLPPMHREADGYDPAVMSNKFQRDPFYYLGKVLNSNIFDKDLVDGIGAHFYIPLNKFEAHARLYEKLVKKPIWVTEFGYSSYDKKTETESKTQLLEQAQFLFESYKLLRGITSHAFWYNDKDYLAKKGREWEGMMGLYYYLQNRLRLKSSFFAYKHAQNEIG